MPLGSELVSMTSIHLDLTLVFENISDQCHFENLNRAVENVLFFVHGHQGSVPIHKRNTFLQCRSCLEYFRFNRLSVAKLEEEWARVFRGTCPSPQFL